QVGDGALLIVDALDTGIGGADESAARLRDGAHLRQGILHVADLDRQLRGTNDHAIQWLRRLRQDFEWRASVLAHGLSSRGDSTAGWRTLGRSGGRRGRAGRTGRALGQ